MTLASRPALVAGVIMALFVVGLAAGVGYPWLSAWLAGAPAQAIVLSADPNCNPLNKPCTAPGEGMAITLQLKGEVRPLKTFQVEVGLIGPDAAAVDKVSVRFAMRGMSMGFNRFEMAQQGDGGWWGQAILPLCAEGRQDWGVTVATAGHSLLYRAGFSLLAGD